MKVKEKAAYFFNLGLHVNAGVGGMQAGCFLRHDRTLLNANSGGQTLIRGNPRL
jgi:hypothetical protein